MTKTTARDQTKTDENATKKFVDLDNAREDDQREQMRKIVEAGHCPFCLENLILYHTIPNEFEGEYWIITLNQWPYKHTQHHFLAILKRHIEMISQLEPEESIELIKLLSSLEKKHQIRGGGLVMRFGDSRYSAGSVAHLHAHFIIPDATAADFEPVRVKLGKKI